ncbi:MAG: hypothetical protein QOH66_2536, partial [Actinomycetota bacterium]|nr:hypothetical protein [Actinomycetota bacterium]
MEELPLPLGQRLSARHWAAIDAVVAALLAAGTAAAVAVGRHGLPTGARWDVVRYLAVATACAPLPLRRRRPIAVLGVATVSVALLVALGVHGPVVLVVALAIYTVAASSAERTPLGVVAAVVGALGLAALVSAGGPTWGDALSGPAVALVGWLAGENARVRHAYVRGVAERAAEREREREERARRAAADERIRIAREL